MITILLFFVDIILVDAEFLSVQESQTFIEGTDAVVLCLANFGAIILGLI